MSRFILYGRIGHGTSSGIILDDGKLTSTYFSKLSSTALNDTVLFFNSCLVHNPPLEPNIINVGTQKFIGGDTKLTIGPSENVFKCWIDGVVKKKSIKSTLNTCKSQISNAGKFGISGNGDDYLSSGAVSIQKPVVSFSEPTASSTVNSNLGVVVNASDPDGSIVNVRLWIDGTEVRPANPETSAPYEWGEANSGNTDQELLNLSPGNHTLKATAKDDGGNSSSATISITVEEIDDNNNDNGNDNGNDDSNDNNDNSDSSSLLEILGCGSVSD